MRAPIMQEEKKRRVRVSEESLVGMRRERVAAGRWRRRFVALAVYSVIKRNENIRYLRRYR